MSQETGNGTDFDSQRTRRQTLSQDTASVTQEYSMPQVAQQSRFVSPHLVSAQGRPNTTVRTGTITAMQRTHGNRAVQRYLRRSGGVGAAPAKPDVAVQRFGEGMWDFAKKLTGLDTVGDSVGKIVKKVQSGYEAGEEKLFDWLGVGHKDKQGGAPTANPGMEHEPYMNYLMEDAIISSYSL
jgi:hypothetical protein